MPPTYANGHISATGDPIHFMFGSRVGFSGTADRTARYLRFEQIQDGGQSYVGKISSVDISATGRPIHFMFGCGVFGDGGSNGAIFDSNKFKMAASILVIVLCPILDNFEWPYLCDGSREST